MPPARLSASDALLRMCILAEIAMAGLNFWLARSIRDWPADLPGPQPLRAVQISEFMVLFVFVPAAIVVAMRWRATRDRRLAGLAIFYALAVAASLAAWAQGPLRVQQPEPRPQPRARRHFRALDLEPPPQLSGQARRPWVPRPPPGRSFL